MVAQENLLGISQHFFTPDIVTKISEIVGQTSEKTKKSLRSIVPTFIGGVVNKGSTPEGAASLVDLINSHNFERNIMPEEIKLNEGDEVLHNVFGSDLEPTLSRLSAQTKLDQTSLSKIMAVVAPMCMGILGAKIKRESLSLSGFMSFIKDQRKILAGYSPSNSEYYSLSGRSPARDYAKIKDQPIWRSWIWTFVLAGALFAWWSAIQYKSPATIVTPVTTITSAPIAQLGDFLNNPKVSELPKSFDFDSIFFLGNTTRLARGFSEITYVAEMLRTHPNTQAQLLSISENVGTDLATIDFATRRADLVRNELVARGVNPKQVQAIGRPGARNSQYQRMQIIINHVK